MICSTFGPHYHLMCAPMTSRERRSVGLAMRLRPEWDEPTALEFVRLFQWRISRAPGGVEGLLRRADGTPRATRTV